MGVRRLTGIVALGWVFSAQALPLDEAATTSLETCAAVEAAWVSATLLEEGGTLSLDEHIFTDLSPITESESGVKLPEDQTLPAN